MKTAVIGASSESIHSIEVAKKMGMTVVALDGNPYAQGLEIADQSIVVNIAEEEATIAAIEKENVDFLITVPIGRYLTTIGAVNDHFHLKGITKKTATYCTDKYMFHKQLEKENLRNCYCFLINQEKVKDVEITFPSILKPRYGSGSRAIYFINNEDELQKSILEVLGLKEDFVLEEAVGGMEYGVDGAVVDGKFQLILLRKKINTPPPVRQAVGYLSQLPEENKDLYEVINTKLQRIVSSLGMTDCLFHADLMISEMEEGKGMIMESVDAFSQGLKISKSKQKKQYEIFPIELSARPSGHYLHNIFTPMVTGIDMAEVYMKYMCGKEFSFVPKEHRKLCIYFFDLSAGTVKKIPTDDELARLREQWLVEWKCGIKIGQVLDSVTNGHSLMGRGYFVVAGETEIEMMDRANQLLTHYFIMEESIG